MALAESASSTQVEKVPSETNKHEKREKPPTKVIIRRLPPTMTLPDFIEQVSPLPDYDYIYAVKGDMSLGENAFSRVYINFTSTEDIFMFKEKFDNYVFVDNKGHEYAAVVEFAAFQKIPKKRGKPRPDPKLATIETEPLYLEFVESLKQQPSQEEKPEFSYQLTNDNKNDMSTPLLDYIKKRKIDRLKSREEKREERRKREIERKKLRDEEKKKRHEEKSPPKIVTIKQSKNEGEKLSKIDEKEKVDKPEKSEKHEKPSYKNKDKKYDEKPATKPKSKFSPRTEKYDSHEKRDYKSRRDDHREKNRRFEDSRKEEEKQSTTTTPKKVKKYSERREERKLEAKRAEQMKEEEKSNKEDEPKQEKAETEKEKPVKNEEEKSKPKVEKKPSKDDHEESKSDDQEKSRNKENDPRVQRRIRNKDRPTMQIYQPGMLSKKRAPHDDDKETKDQEKE